VNTELCLMCLKGRPKGVREEDRCTWGGRVYLWILSCVWCVWRDVLKVCVRRTCISVNTELCLMCLKGRPKGVREEDVYICEYRVDRSARRFSKIKQLHYAVNCSSYCFNRFLHKLQPKRTYIVCYLQFFLLCLYTSSAHWDGNLQ